MNKIKLHDKYFEPFILFEKIEDAINRISIDINRDVEGLTPIFLVILNGSFMFAGDLLKKIDTPCEVSFVKLSSYDGTKSTKKVKQLIGFNEDIKGRTIVIVEDIVDSGNTLENVLGQLDSMGAADVKIATLLFKPQAFEKSYSLDYIGIEIPNDFIVGYGLDYNNQGRNLKDIYKIIE